MSCDVMIVYQLDFDCKERILESIKINSGNGSKYVHGFK